MRNQFLKLILSTVATVSICGTTQAQIFRPASEYSPIGLEACQKASSLDRQDCLESIRGVWFDEKIHGLCSRSIDIEECLQAAANKKYDPAEIRICAKEMTLNRPECLQRFGRPYTGATSTGEILGEALDQILTDVLNEYFGSSANNASEVCDVQNSSGKSLARVSRDDFSQLAKQYALRKNSCVVSNIKNETRTRDLISPTGRSIAIGMTEQETANKKRAYGYDRCQILTCVAEVQQRPRMRYDRIDNNYGGRYDGSYNNNRYNGGVIHESWGTR